jgi:hypothetical protein
VVSEKKRNQRFFCSGFVLQYLIIAPVVQWIELLRPKEEMWVRFLPGAQRYTKENCTDRCNILLCSKQTALLAYLCAERRHVP